ncbi:VCBS repeat-containing protein [candidate division KSB1 bacterium]|nr:VCBS repeat-containing protein [candidate division KSB1 bacterium]
MTKIIIPIVFLFACISFAQPYQPHVIWDRSGETDSSSYGYKILPLGDQNNDGFADWAVFAQGNGTWLGTQRPYLEFFHGNITPDTVPYDAYRADTTLYRHNWFAFPCGDVNGDGYQDWLIRQWQQSQPPNYTIFIFYGGPNADNVPDIVLSVPVGSSFYQVGDFNGDGYDDLYWSHNDASIRVYYGGSPMDTTVDWYLHEPPPGINSSFPYAIGDFNGDGASDFMCFNMNNGNLAVFLGGANPDTIPAYFWSNMSRPTTGVDSLNGDGADEFVRGTPVHFGRPVLSPVPDIILNTSVVSHSDCNLSRAARA